MHRVLIRRLANRRTDERGLVAIMVALSMTALVVSAALVLDFGLVRVDRQVNKSAADAATTAGLYALNGGTGDARPFAGVCTAIRYLRQNDVRFQTVTDTSGSWTTGTGVATGNGCTDTTLQNQKCTPGSESSWARYTWTGTYQGQALVVTIQSGYSLAASGYSEDDLPAAVADSNDSAQGCNQLAVVIKQNRKPGLGSLARASDLTTTIRSVGRVKSSPSGDAPAMLLLKQTGCPVLSTGSNGGGSYVHVYGAVSTSGLSQPGSIHSDSNGVGCSGSLFEGKAGNGVVAYAAPLVSNPSLPDTNKPGQLTSVAGANGVGIGTVRDAAANVYASAALNETGAAAAAQTAPTGRSTVTRKLVDERYLGTTSPTNTGVRGIVASAQSGVFSKTVSNAAQALAAGYERYTNKCAPTAADLSAVTSTSNLWIDCTANSGFTGTAPILAKRVVFAGSIQPPNDAAGVSLPNAEKVYVFGDPTKNAISLSTGSVFSMNTTGNLSGTSCANTQSTSRAVLVMKAGALKQTGGALQLCKTTVVMMGGSPNGCLPSASGNPPTQTPCPSSSMGDGQLSQNGGNVDWTAPNQYDQMTLASGEPDPTKSSAWTNVDGPEDLAFWSESAGNNSSATYNMNGGGTLHTVGVYMVPNADSFAIGGGAHQDLTNAQYIATSIALNGNTTSITMRVDANSAVTLPRLRLVGLVR